MSSRAYLFDGGRREAAVFAVLAAGLILLRCFVPVYYEGFHFDSDQAVVGLMAKHLSELRAFPLFFYGQHYMLGVQAWEAAPFFLIGGPTVAMLRAPLVIVNVAVGLVLMRILVNEGRLRPALAFVAALPVILPPPVAAISLLSTLGASIEPLLYVLLLWLLRRSPLPFGLLLAVGFLHREFTIFAVPALAVVMAVDGSLFRRQTIEKALTALVAFVGVWTVVELGKGFVDVYGPTTGPLENGSLTLQMQSLVNRACFTAAGFLARGRSLFADCLTDLFGTRHIPLTAYSGNSTVSVGMNGLAWVLLAAAALMAGRALMVRRRGVAPASTSFFGYLGLVGVLALVAYPLACEVIPGFYGLIRYVLFALFIPVAIVGFYLRTEQVPALKVSAVAVVLFWAALSLGDHLKLLHEYRTDPPVNKFRLLSDYLVAHQITYARADYWDAYIVDFFSREQAIVGSEGKVRVREYELQVERHRAEAARIVRVPCSNGTHVDAWCVERP